jgi:transposase
MSSDVSTGRRGDARTGGFHPPAHSSDGGIDREALRQWVRQAGAGQGRRPGLLRTGEREELRRLRKENAELRRANANLKDASVYFATELDPTGRR